MIALCIEVIIMLTAFATAFFSFFKDYDVLFYISCFVVLFIAFYRHHQTMKIIEREQYKNNIYDDNKK